MAGLGRVPHVQPFEATIRHQDAPRQKRPGSAATVGFGHVSAPQERASRSIKPLIVLSTVKRTSAFEALAALPCRLPRHPLVANILLPPLVSVLLYRVPFDTPREAVRLRCGTRTSG